MDRRLKRRRRRSPLPVLLSILIIVLAVLAAAYFFQRHAAISDEMDRASYYGLTSDREAALVVNDSILEAKGRVSDGTIYIDYETVYRYFNSGFYWENATRSLLLTQPSGTKSWTADDGSGALLVDGGLPYISAECIRENSDIDLAIYTEPDRVVARTRWEGISAMNLAEDGEVRYRGGPKSEILTHVKAGDTVVLLERLADWYKVSTTDGFQGYIERKKLTEAPEGTISHATDARFLFPHIYADKKICLGWEYVGSVEGNAALPELIAGADTLNTISPTWFSFDGTDGTLLSYASADYVEQAHAAGIAVWGCLQDVRGQDDLGELLNSREKRSRIIEQLLSAAAATGMDGINLDLETLQEEDAPHYLQFLKEICVEAHAQGLIVSTDNYVPMYTRYYNHAEQARTVDYLIIMAYDEHTANSGEAGSVSSLPFMEQGITDMLELVNAEQVICGIPFFTRSWTENTSEGTISTEALGMAGGVEFAAAHGIELRWDAETGQNTGSTEDGEIRYSIWNEDLQSQEERMKLIRRYELAGVAAWRLGFESPEVWPLIGSYLE